MVSRASGEVLKPDHRACDLEEGEIVPRGLLEARGKSPEALEVVKEDLDAVAYGVSASVETRLFLASRVRMNDGLDPHRTQLVANSVGVVAGVGYEGFATRVVFDDRRGDG